MSIRVVLAIGFDPWWFEAQRSAWQTSGNFVTPAGSTAEAIRQFHDGDFDAVLLGRSIPQKSKEQIISWIRSTGSTVPVVCVVEPSSACVACEFGTTSGEPSILMRRIGELLEQPAKKPVGTAKAAGADAQAGRRSAGVSRSVLRHGTLRGPAGEGQVDLFPQFPGAESPCFSIRLQASDDASAGVSVPAPVRARERRAAKAR